MDHSRHRLVLPSNSYNYSSVMPLQHFRQTETKSYLDPVGINNLGAITRSMKFGS